MYDREKPVQKSDAYNSNSYYPKDNTTFMTADKADARASGD